MLENGGGPTATNNTSGAMDANSVSIDGVLQPAYTPSGSPTIYPVAMSVEPRMDLVLSNIKETEVLVLRFLMEPHKLQISPSSKQLIVY